MARKATSLRGMTMTTLECRVLRHAWEHVITFKLAGGLLELNFQCARCDTMRLDTVSRKRFETRQYKHSEGYLVDNLQDWGGRKVINENVREELFARYSKGAKVRKAVANEWPALGTVRIVERKALSHNSQSP